MQSSHRRLLIIVTISCTMLAGGCQFGKPLSPQKYNKTEAALKIIDEGRKLEQAGSPLLALDRYNRAASQYASPASYYEMGRIFERMQKNSEAATAYQQALRLAPDLRDARLALLALGYQPDGMQPTADEIQQANAWAASRVDVSVIEPMTNDRPETETVTISDDERTAERDALKEQAGSNRLPTDAEMKAILFSSANGSMAMPSADDPAYESNQDIILGSYPYHFKKAEQMRGRQLYESAAEEYQRALEADPKQIAARLALGDMLMKLEKFPRARFHFERALEEFPASPLPHLKLGNYYMAINQPQKARDQYQKALERKPNFVEARNNLAVMAMKDKNYKEAAAQLDIIIQVEPGYSNAYLNRGIIASDIENDKPLALKHFRKYAELNGPRTAQVQTWIKELEQPKSE